MKNTIVPDTNQIVPAGNPKIEVFEIIGGLSGNRALEIQFSLYRCLDEGKCYQVIDLEHVNQIDGLGIAILEKFLSRGLQIRLINVKPEIKSVIRMAKKDSLFQIIYNEKDRNSAVSLFEKDIAQKKIIPGDSVFKKRHHIRINTSFPVEFKFRRNRETISGRANILNLSEGGVLAGGIVVMKENTEEPVRYPGMVEQDICDMKFKLNGDSTSLVMQGRCVREFIQENSVYAGIRFKDIRHDQKETIRFFVNAHR
ncbi:MAG: PilZ domain-containing protein [Candidatus Brocadia sp.]|nr:PilZ domain-containing protein [Candidatus Brocadia sp.]